MKQDQWTAVDHYITETLVKPDNALRDALERSDEAGLPAISVSPAQGKFLMQLAMVLGAKNVLEIGTLGGYSTIWLARGMAAGGKLITLEAEKRHADVARRNLEAAGVGTVVEIVLGGALESLPNLEKQGRGPFDLIFVDADKSTLPDYFKWSMKLSKSGSVIVIDNVVRKGEVLDTSGRDASVAGVRRMNELIAAEPKACATTIQTVSVKGYDGFTMIVVK